MRKILLKCAWMLCFLLSTTLFAQTGSIEPTKGVLRVKLQQEVAAQFGNRPVPMSNGLVTTGIEPFDRASKKIKAVRMERVFPYVERMEEKARKHGLHLWYELRFDENVDPIEAVNSFKNIAGVIKAENLVPMELVEGNSGFIKISEAQKSVLNTRAEAMPFNDPLLSSQWHYQNTGSVAGSVAGADINLFNAWKVATGSRDLLVAIIDGGIDYKHVDLTKNVYINEKELNGVEGVDDDGNGFVDDIYGYNFITNSGDVYAHDHGTHVAGTVGAVNNNGLGVAGVAGGNGQGGIKMLSCQIFDSRISNREADCAKAFYYATVQGAVIAQCSWGWTSPGYWEDAVLDAIRFFTEEAESDFMKGGLAIFANGNTGLEGEYYPGCIDEVVAVGSMTCDKKPASYSTYGDWVDVTAPGGDTDFNTVQGVLSTLPNDDYGFAAGTSMACPHVSGIAALILSKYGNPGFPNESLRLQLLTSVNDFYTDNPTVLGKYGSGYIDATKAMEMGSGTPPKGISTFELIPSQDNITIEWTIPESEDNSIYYHLIYYSQQPFTASSDLASISNKKFNTQFNASGDVVNYELNGLSPTTTYYVALQAFDRWGNGSTLSSVQSTTTNDGPKMELNKSSLSMVLNAANSPYALENFIIKNTDKGMLKWETYSRTSSMYPSSIASPTPGPLVSQTGDISLIPHSAYSVVSSDYVKEDYPKEIYYTTNLDLFVGESDLELTNSMAQWFYVSPTDYPNGFNLTDLSYQGSYGDKPVIEIYDGSTTLANAKLLSKVSYDFFAYGYDISLKEQLYFAPGEAFWVITHFNKGYINPLGAGTVSNQTATLYSFYSSDWGKTWSLLSEVLKGTNFEDLAKELGWSIVAKSKNPDWSSLLVLNPSNGTVKPNEEQPVEVTNDGQSLVNGSYSFNLKISTNEAVDNEKSLPISLSVTGNAPELKTAQMVNFGDLLLGQSKTLRVEVTNAGFGVFTLPWSNAITCNSDQFVMPGYTPSFAARATSYIDITFKPTVAGSYSGTVTLNSSTGLKHTFIVRGIAEEPAKIELTPGSFNLGDLEVGGESKEITFTITNQGKYPLAYTFPKYSDVEIEDSNTSSHKFGYSYISNLQGATDFEYDGNPELINAVDITAQFDESAKWSKAIQLDFSFPYYGKDYDKIYITNYGGVAISTEGAIHACVIPTSSPSCVRNLGLISIYGIGATKMNANSKVLYGMQNGKLVIKYINVLAVGARNNYVPISFHMTLAPNGDVEMFYDDYTPALVSTGGAGIFVGLNDLMALDPITITDYWDYTHGIYAAFGTGSAVKFIAPEKPLVQKLSSTNGMIAIGESKEITATVAAIEGMVAGEINNRLTIVSNDPASPVTHLNLTANIVGESLKPTAVIVEENVDFGTVFRTSTTKKIVTLKNAGTDKLTVTGIELANNSFTFSQEVPFVIAANSSKDIVVTMPTNQEGAVNDVLTFTTEDGNKLEAQLQGVVIGVPEMAFNMEGIVETVASGEPLTKTLIVENKGNENLNFSVSPNDYYRFTNLNADNYTSIGYAYKSSVEYSEVKYDWQDIETTGEGEHLTFSSYLGRDYIEVELPYEISFYGEKYTKAYIYSTGFISFNHNEDLKEFPSPPQTLPVSATFYTNIIAPYWGVHYMSQQAIAGVYYAFREDCMIVSFMDYGNSLNNGVCFQAIIRLDGSIKFQYKLVDSYGTFLALYGVNGVQNNGGTEGACLPSRCITMGSAAEFYPIRNTTIEPGSSNELELVFNTDLLAGNYKSEVILHNNVPTSPKVELPIDLTITGEPIAIYPTEVTEESVVGVHSGAYTLDVYFEMANQGTAAYTITDITAPGLIGYPATSGALQYYGLFNSMWGSAYQYGNYTSGTKLTVGKEPISFKVAFRNINAIGEYEIPLTFTVEGLDKEVIEIPFKVNITPAPALAFENPEVHIKGVTDDYKENVDIVIKNVGEYKLKYSLELDATGSAASTFSNDVKLKASSQAAKAFATEHAEELSAYVTENKVPTTRATNLDIPQGIEYKRALYHPMFPDNNKLYLIGSGNTTSAFKAATRFTAPEDGFNMSHVYFYSTIGNLQNVDIIAEIIQGSDIESGEVIGKGTLHVESEDPISTDLEGNPVYNGRFRILSLDKEVYLNPNETFYVSFTFPVGFNRSMGIVPKEEAVVANRYMHWLSAYGWLDTGTIYESQIGSSGYFTTCLEMNEGGSWVRLLNTETAGTIEIGESNSITIGFNAAAARMDKNNKAILVVRSNDPNQPVVNYPIYLDKNTAPEFTTPANMIYAKEGETSIATIVATDLDGDSYSISISDESGIAKLQEVTAAENSNVVIENITNNSFDVKTNDNEAVATVNINVSFTPDYGTSGLYNLNITGTDALGNVATKEVKYYVQHVNRAPVAIEQSNIELSLHSTTEIINFSSLFSDPDDDKLSYTMTIAEEGVVDAYIAAESVIFVGKKTGETMVTITASDESGAKTQNSFKVIVSAGTGIEDASADKAISIYPNPIVDFANITINKDVNGNTNYRIYDAKGMLIYSESALVTSGEIHMIDMSHFENGIYYIEIEVNNTTKSIPVIKK